jgi:hypothetical protein
MFFKFPFSKVIVFVVSHFSHFAPKSVMFQKAWGVGKFGSPHFLHVIRTIKRSLWKWQARTIVYIFADLQ